MALDLNQIRKSLKSPQKKQAINKAVSFEKRLRFHTETHITESGVGFYATTFLDWVKQLLPRDKYNVFLQLFSYPLPTVAVVEEVYRELERIFNSRNSSTTYQFTDSEALRDWEAYRKDVLNEPEIWRNEGFRMMKVAINSVLIIDLPSEQTSDLPEPYFYWLDISKVIDYQSPNGKVIDWIIFEQPDSTIAVFDDTYMRKYKIDDKKEIVSEIASVNHELNSCPARFFWSSNLTEADKDLKKNPITKELSNLDWLLFFEISKRHLDLYAPYPIYSAYESECDFVNDETGDHCDGGFLKNESGSYLISRGGLLYECPACSEKRLSGPGSFVEIPSPVEGSPDLRSPVQITTIDKNSLDYNVNECVRLRDKIITSCVGAGGDVSEKEAINETQVAANFESKTSVLNKLKVNFENAQKFVEDTICKIRYGEDFLSSSHSWGTEFYVFTVDNLYKRYKQAKDNGASDSELDALSIQILETEYKNNPVQLQRMLTLRQLEPLRHSTLEEALKLHEKGLIDDETMILKINFVSLIDKFERENTNIVEFGNRLDFNTKINKITLKLNDYVKNQRSGYERDSRSTVD